VFYDGADGAARVLGGGWIAKAERGRVGLERAVAAE